MLHPSRERVPKPNAPEEARHELACRVRRVRVSLRARHKEQAASLTNTLHYLFPCAKCVSYSEDSKYVDHTRNCMEYVPVKKEGVEP